MYNHVKFVYDGIRSSAVARNIENTIQMNIMHKGSLMNLKIYIKINLINWIRTSMHDIFFGDIKKIYARNKVSKMLMIRV